jgi:hypothetical protein
MQRILFEFQPIKRTQSFDDVAYFKIKKIEEERKRRDREMMTQQLLLGHSLIPEFTKIESGESTSLPKKSERKCIDVAGSESRVLNTPHPALVATNDADTQCKKIKRKRQPRDPTKPRKNSNSLMVKLQMGSDSGLSQPNGTPEDRLSNMLKPQDPSTALRIGMDEQSIEGGRKQEKKPRKKGAPRDPNKPKIQRKRKQLSQIKVESKNAYVESDFFKKGRKRARVDSNSLPSIHEIHPDANWQTLLQPTSKESNSLESNQGFVSQSTEQRVPSSTSNDILSTQELEEWVTWSGISSPTKGSEKGNEEHHSVPEPEKSSSTSGCQHQELCSLVETASFAESLDLGQQESIENALTRSETVELPFPRSSDPHVSQTGIRKIHVAQVEVHNFSLHDVSIERVVFEPPIQSQMTRNSTYDDIAKVSSFGKSPSGLLEQFFEDTLFADCVVPI